MSKETNQNISFIESAKWLLGIVAAGTISMWSAKTIVHYNIDPQTTRSFSSDFWIFIVIVPAVSFGLFIFLAALFVPRYKKFASMFVLLLAVLFFGYGLIQHYIDNGTMGFDYLMKHLGIAAGLTAGYVSSFFAFRKKKWRS